MSRTTNGVLAHLLNKSQILSEKFKNYLHMKLKAKSAGLRFSCYVFSLT